MSDSAAEPEMPIMRPRRCGRLSAVLLLGAALGAVTSAQAQPVQLQPARPPAQEQPAQPQAPTPQAPASQAPAPVGGAPLRLVPFGQNQPPAAGAALPAAPSGLQVEALGALSADTGGTLRPGAGGLPADAWAGTSRPLAEALIAGLPDRQRSAALRAALSRLLLSDIAPPAGDPGERGFAARRLERLALLGDLAGADAFAAAVPAALEDEGAARAWLTGRLLAGDAEAGCGQVGENVRKFRDPIWQKFQIACQVRAGELAAALLDINLLREQGDADEDFLLLAESAAAGRTAPVKGVVEPTAPQLALILAGKRSPDPETRVTDPAGLAALARSAEVPIQLRLPAAEGAAAFGLLSPAELMAVYQSVSIADNELRDPLTAVTRKQGAQARALLIQAIRNATSAGIKAELLRAAVAAGDVPLLTGTYGLVLAQELGQLPPSSSYAFLAPSAARALLLQNRADLARSWVDIARADQAGGNADPTEFYRLWPLAALNGLARPTDVDMTAWRESVLGPPEGPRRVGADTETLALLNAAGVPLDRAVMDRAVAEAAADRDAADDGCCRVSPLVAQRLAQAAADGREAETILLAAALMDQANNDRMGDALAVDALRRAGLTEEARRLATESVAALMTP